MRQILTARFGRRESWKHLAESLPTLGSSPDSQEDSAELATTLPADLDATKAGIEDVSNGPVNPVPQEPPRAPEPSLTAPATSSTS